MITHANYHSWLPQPDLYGFLAHAPRRGDYEYVAFLPTLSLEGFMAIRATARLFPWMQALCEASCPR